MGACSCEERKKPLPERNWEIESYQPYKYWGPNASSYDGRRLLHLKCNVCRSIWTNKDRYSKYWAFINEKP